MYTLKPLYVSALTDSDFYYPHPHVGIANAGD
jgi:hypothetical protein